MVSCGEDRFMTRRSVTLDGDQEEWITTKAEELSVSKSKVIRECIEVARGQESLLTTMVNTETDDGQQPIEELQERLSDIEAVLEEHVEIPDSDEGDAPLSSPAPGGCLANEDFDTVRDEVEEAGTDDFERDLGRPAEGRPGDDSKGVSPSPRNLGEAEPSDSAVEESNSSAGTHGAPEPERPDRGGESRPFPDAETNQDEHSPEPEPESPLEQQPNLSKSDPESIADYLDTYYDDEVAQAVFECWDKLSHRGTEHVRSFKALYDEYPLEYDSADQWWDDEIRPIFLSLPGVEAPEGGGSLYRFKY